MRCSSIGIELRGVLDVQLMKHATSGLPFEPEDLKMDLWPLAVCARPIGANESIYEEGRKVFQH